VYNDNIGVSINTWKGNRQKITNSLKIRSKIIFVNMKKYSSCRN
jgi:hypothetical protein